MQCIAESHDELLNDPNDSNDPNDPNDPNVYFFVGSSAGLT